MEDRNNKTIICSVLFLDIVEYSKKSVAGQISLKERFNAFLSIAIRDIPMDDRIILDTGDGAAISFLGDVEDSLKVALSMRASLLNAGAHMEPLLMVRMGINLGPVCLVKDINDQPNIVGDGINVAQRIMEFSEPGQILVSRSYYEAASRLSHDYAGMFHYLGVRTDKHVREHEVYALGNAAEFAEQYQSLSNKRMHASENGPLLAVLKKTWDGSARTLGEAVLRGTAAFQTATPARQVLYLSGLLVGALLLFGVIVKLFGTQTHKELPVVAKVQEKAVAKESKRAPSQAAAPESAGKPDESQAESAAGDAAVAHKKEAKSKPAKKGDVVDKLQAMLQQKKDAVLEVQCKPGALLYVDAWQKGKVGSAPLTIPLTAGKHTIIIDPPGNGAVYSKELVFGSGQIVKLSPGLCQ